MKDKDTKLLEEAYETLKETKFPFGQNDPDKKIPDMYYVLYHDEQSSDTQTIDIERHEDDTVSINFGHSFKISRMPVEDAAEFARILNNASESKEEEEEIHPLDRTNWD